MRTISLLSFGLILLSLPTMSTEARPVRSPVVLDSKGNVRTFYGIPVTLTRAGLKRLGFRIKIGYRWPEGNRETVYTLTAQQGVKVEVTFDDDGKLYGARTMSRNAIGPKGIGIGSTLADVKAAWPEGKLLFGFEDGYFVTFVTGTNVLFRFNPADMPRGAFDHDRPWDFPVPETIKIQTISVYPESNPIPKGLPPIDQNKTWMTEESSADHKIISRLDVERIPGSELVRLVWTHKGKIEADRMIDVSGYPELDIWTREIVSDSDPVVISFRYGRFKDCAVRDDDRDKMYVILHNQGVILSSRSPEGVQADNRWAPRKTVGNLMNSAAHGCRRTYDPESGAFGLEKAE